MLKQLLAATATAALASTPASAITNTPYYTGASERGAEFWSWTLSTLEEEQDFVQQRMEQARQTIDRQTQGYYDLDANNEGVLSCLERSENVAGFGAQVFEEGVRLVTQYNLTGCTLEIQN